jgi:hypothetical protein
MLNTEASAVEKTDGIDIDNESYELETLLYARHVELESLTDLEQQRGTPIPALFNQFYKFIQNPSSVSIETFKRMIDTDDTVGSGVDFLTTCLAARLGRYQHKNQEITEWVNERLEQIENGWYNVVKELLSASWAGFCVMEKVWANTKNGFVPQKLVSLPPSTILFETDRTGEITSDGILQYQRNFNPQLLSQGAGFFGGIGTGFGFSDSIRPDMYAKMGDLPFPMRTANTFNYLSIRIPRQKCIHYAFDAQGKFGNPYGRSLLRRAYKFWVTKDEVLRMLAIALDRKGTPLTVIFADPNATIGNSDKMQEGVNYKGQRGKGIRADLAAQQAFSKVHNDSSIVLPGKKGQIYDIEFVPQTSNANDFLESLRFCNQSLLRSMLIPSLIFGNGDGSGSFALGQEHAKTFDKICDGMLAGLKHTIIQQLIKEMLAYNFKKVDWEKDGYGDFAKRELSQEERDKEVDAIEKGVNMGAIDMSDLNDTNKIRDVLGFEARDKVLELDNEPDEIVTDEKEDQE